VESGEFTTTVEEIFPTSGRPTLLGSGASLFEEVGKELFSAGVPRGTPEVFVRTLRDGRARQHKIGGVPASLTATVAGAAVDVVLHWDGTEISEYVLGLPIRQAGGKIGGLGAGFWATEPDYFYRLGESILQKEHIEERDLATRESLRDLAVIHNATKFAIQFPDVPGVRQMSGEFYVHAYDPEPLQHCYCIKCPNCPAEVPLFLDLSAGQVRYPIFGALLVRACLNCGVAIHARSEQVFSRQWPTKAGLSIFKQ
jgi:hypothetical protein